MSFSKVVILSLTVLLITGCGKKKQVCKDSPQDFKTIYGDLASLDDKVTMDAEIHEYSFNVSSEQEICKIGYSSFWRVQNKPYTIEIFDHTDSVTLYRDDHKFSSAGTSYIVPSQPVIFLPNHEYSIRRIQTNWGSDITKTVGRIKVSYDLDNPIDFPLTSGVLTITGTQFYDEGRVPDSPNRALPYIDMVFKN